MFRRLWYWFLAPFSDYHDYGDTEDKEPWHFVELECERCGKKFYI